MQTSQVNSLLRRPTVLAIRSAIMFPLEFFHIPRDISTLICHWPPCLTHMETYLGVWKAWNFHEFPPYMSSFMFIKCHWYIDKPIDYRLYMTILIWFLSRYAIHFIHFIPQRFKRLKKKKKHDYGSLPKPRGGGPATCWGLEASQHLTAWGRARHDISWWFMVITNIFDIWLIYWLVVWTPLKNISQLGWLFPIYGKIKNVPNHQPV